MMIISKENKEKYNRLGIDTQKLKQYYIDRAKELSKHLKPYSDTYSNELKTVLARFTETPNKDLVDVIDEVKTPIRGYNSFGVNGTLFDNYYPDELLECDE